MADKRKVTFEISKLVSKQATISSNRWHVMPRQNNWVVRKDGALRALGVYERRDDAINRVKEVVKDSGGGYAYIHGKDGRIVSEINYLGE